MSVLGRLFGRGGREAGEALVRGLSGLVRGGARETGEEAAERAARETLEAMAQPGSRVFVAGPTGTTVRRQPLALPAAGQTTVGTGSGSRLAADVAERNAARMAAARAAADEAADLPGRTLRQRAAAMAAPGSKTRKAGMVGLTLGGLEGLGQATIGAGPLSVLFRGLGSLMEEAPEDPQVDLAAALAAIGAANQQPESSYEDRFRQFLDENPYSPVAVPNLIEDVDAYGATRMADLDAYLASTGLYGQNQAQAISDAYQQLSQNLLESSGDVFQRGQVTAADIDRIYETLAAESLGGMYDPSMGTPMSDVAGLTAPSGEMATAADVARTYGGSLADYLGQEAGIESAALEQMAGSQALQGAALAQSLRDYIAMADVERRNMLGQELAAARLDAQRQQDMLAYQAAEEAAAYDRAARQELFGWAEQDRARAEEMELVKQAAASEAAGMWLRAQRDPDMKERYEALVNNATGQAGLQAFMQLAYDNPNLIAALGG